jgi:hypothetical protein
VGSIGLLEQFIIPYFSRSSFALPLVVLPMIFLTINATILNEFAGAFLEFHIINFRFAAVSTRLVCRLICPAHDVIIFIIVLSTRIIITPLCQN